MKCRLIYVAYVNQNRIVISHFYCLLQVICEHSHLKISDKGMLGNGRYARINQDIIGYTTMVILSVQEQMIQFYTDMYLIILPMTNILIITLLLLLSQSLQSSHQLIIIIFILVLHFYHHHYLNIMIIRASSSSSSHHLVIVIINNMNKFSHRYYHDMCSYNKRTL